MEYKMKEEFQALNFHYLFKKKKKQKAGCMFLKTFSSKQQTNYDYLICNLY